ncbi:ABC transporter permease [Brucella melitensis]|uniref:ABC transporter permease n=1 Tax=Brucella melitensis TaxID=29459 RepID=UPI0031FD929D
MVAFLAKRLGWGLAVLLSVGVLTFALARLVPADPASFLAGQNASTETVERIQSELGLDRPALEQFASYFTGILRGDLGQSIRTGRPVAEDLAQFLPATLELMIAGFFLYMLISFGLALLALRKPDGMLDKSVRLVTMLGTGIPVFWLGMGLQFIFFYKLGWLPLSSRFPVREIAPAGPTGFLLIDTLVAGNLRGFGLALQHLCLPALTIVMNLLAVGTRLTRSTLLDEREQPYVRTALGKGLTGRSILLKHMLRNAANPILVTTSMQFGYLISWILMVEVIFEWPGIGLYAYKSFQLFDYAPVIALALVSTAGFVIINLAVDLVQPLIDPRIRKST